MAVVVRAAGAPDLDGWARLRAELWPDGAFEDHRREVAAFPTDGNGQHAAFLAVANEGGPLAFAEASLRHDHVNGCETSPVAFLEGIYVRPAARGSGLGRRLVAAVRAWARERGCSELASDAALDNTASHAFHAALGFEETERVVYFRARL